MIRRKTVLVLGAGASMHLQFPSGAGLVTLVLEGLRNEAQELFRLLRERGFSSQQITAFRDALQRSGRPSVDVFLEHRPEFVALGKTAIAALLTPLELEANLYAGPNWYARLFQHLGPSLNDVQQSRLSIVTFNYERSVEHYLFTALQNSFNLTDAQTLPYFDFGTGAALHGNAIPIVHVYGKLGALPYVGGENARPYAPPGAHDLANVAFAIKESIKIMHEGVADNLALGRASQLVREADVICFLGFGYLEENLKRLRLDQRKDDAVVWGSAYGLGQGERVPVETFFQAHGKRQIVLGQPGQDAMEFLRQHAIFV